MLRTLVLLVVATTASSSSLISVAIKHAHTLWPAARHFLPAAYGSAHRSLNAVTGQPTDLLAMKRVMCVSDRGRAQLESMLSQRLQAAASPVGAHDIADCVCAMDLSHPAIAAVVQASMAGRSATAEQMQRAIPAIMSQRTLCHGKCQHLFVEALLSYMHNDAYKGLFTEQFAIALSAEMGAGTESYSAAKELAMQSWDSFAKNSSEVVHCMCDPIIDWTYLVSSVTAVADFSQAATLTQQVGEEAQGGAVVTDAERRAVVQADLRAGLEIMKAIMSEQHGVCQIEGVCRRLLGDCVCHDGIDYGELKAFYEKDAVKAYVDDLMVAELKNMKLKKARDPNMPVSLGAMALPPPPEGYLTALKQLNRDFCSAPSCQELNSKFDALLEIENKSLAPGAAEETCSAMFGSDLPSRSRKASSTPVGIFLTLLALAGLTGSFFFLHKKGKLPLISLRRRATTNPLAAPLAESPLATLALNDSAAMQAPPVQVIPSPLNDYPAMQAPQVQATAVEATAVPAATAVPVASEDPPGSSV